MHARRSFRSLGLVLAIALLWGCTADWKAPVETRGGAQGREVAPVVSSRSSASPKKRIYANTYRVKSGDTLIAIAFRADADYRDIAEWNNLPHPYTIYPGQVLRLNQPASKTTKTTKAKPRKIRPRASSTGPLGWIWPAKGRVFSSFNLKQQRKGIKIAGKLGSDIKAVESGKVVYAGSGLIGYGRLIIIKHNENYLSAYGHNKELLVKQGDKIAKGAKIATMGQGIGGKSLLHFEIRRDGKPVNPLRLLPKH